MARLRADFRFASRWPTQRWVVPKSIQLQNQNCGLLDTNIGTSSGGFCGRRHAVRLFLPFGGLYVTQKEKAMDEVAKRPTQIDCYRLVRERMDQENTLITTRLSWFITAQSFLFAAYGLSIRERVNDSHDLHLLAQLRWLIPVVAFSSGVLIYVAILAGFFAVLEDRSLLVVQLEKAKANPDFPALRSPCWRFWSGLVAPLLLPPLLILAWLFLWLFPGVRPPG
jgi:hypothetical protein